MSPPVAPRRVAVGRPALAAAAALIGCLGVPAAALGDPRPCGEASQAWLVTAATALKMPLAARECRPGSMRILLGPQGHADSVEVELMGEGRPALFRAGGFGIQPILEVPD